jgi:glycosyltransferase involved in cell wall biosynthesis
VVTVHDLTFERYPELYPKRWLSLYRRGLKVAAAEASAIVTPSEHVRDEVAAFTGIERSRLHVTPLASAMREPDEAARADRGDHGISPPYVLAVGTLEPRKNLARLVRAYRSLAEEGFSHALVIVGPEGWGSGELRDEIERGGAGRIVQAFLGEEALAAAYADADAVAYVSLYEGFGLPILEAMSMGAAVVASNVAAIPEVAVDAAMLVDPTDEEAIADALRQVLTEPALRGDLSQRGRERAAGFSWEATARATLDVYREVLA